MKIRDIITEDNFGMPEPMIVLIKGKQIQKYPMIFSQFLQQLNIPNIQSLLDQGYVYLSRITTTAFNLMASNVNILQQEFFQVMGAIQSLGAQPNSKVDISAGA